MVQKRVATYVKVDFIRNVGTENSGKEEAQAQPDVSQATNARVEVIHSGKEVYGRVRPCSLTKVFYGLPGNVANMR